jgi:predicted outer membrane repeat protein
MRSMNSKLGLPLSLFGLLLAGTVQAATITPNITTDPALVGPDTGTDCSLRYAIESINDGTDFEGGCAAVSTGVLGTGDTVVLGPNTYLLELDGDEDDNATGDLDVLANMAIEGAGPDSTTIDASGIPSGDRALYLTDSTSEVSLSGLTITGGDSNGGSGGGILADVDGTLTIDNTHVVGNLAGNGGGIYVDFGSTVLINNATLDDNESSSCGGGLFIVAATVGVSNSTISNNDATDSDGGGICQFGDELFLTNTTISTNTAASDGGGIYTEADDDSTLDTTTGLKGAYNVTIVMNQASGVGGGIASNVQILPQGGTPPFPTRVFNSIIALNTASTGQDCANGNFYTGGYNLIGQIDPNDICVDFVNGVNGDQVGTTESPIDPLIGQLQFNDGTTSGLTHALLEGSPAIDRGNPDGCQAADVQAFIDSGSETFVDLTTDQRLLTRPVAILDPNVPICDIGAYEFQIAEPTPTPTPTPTATPVPPFNAFIEGSGCSLTAGAASAQSLGLLGLAAGWCAWALRRRMR